MKLNINKCVFRGTSRKVLGFILGIRGIEIDPVKIKAIHDMSTLHTEMEVHGFLERLNYVRRSIAQLTVTCKLLFKLLRKDMTVVWNEDRQEAFDKIKRYS